MDLELLKELLSHVACADVDVTETGSHPTLDFEEWGSEVEVANTISVWREPVEVTTLSILGESTKTQPGFVVATVTVFQGHPMDPPSVDVCDSEEHDTWEGACADIVHRFIGMKVSAFFEQKAEERMAAEYEADEEARLTWEAERGSRLHSLGV